MSRRRRKGPTARHQMRAIRIFIAFALLLMAIVGYIGILAATTGTLFG